jgi:hypothetical protein
MGFHEVLMLKFYGTLAESLCSAMWFVQSKWLTYENSQADKNARKFSPKSFKQQPTKLFGEAWQFQSSKHPFSKMI